MTMLTRVETPRRLGQLIRATRKQQGLRQDEIARFSHSFVGEVEKGKPTAQIGKLLELLRELGIRVHLELPANVDPTSSIIKRKAAAR